MKCIGSFIVLALINLITVLAGPPPHAYVREGGYEYYIQFDGSNQAFITNVLDKSATTLYINPYFYYNNVKYDVMAISGGLTDCAVTTLVIPHYIYHPFGIWDNVLKEAKNLRDLKIQSLNDVDFYENTFNGVSTNLQISGQGVDHTMRRYAKKFLQENHPDLIKDYSKLSNDFKKCGLYQIAKIVNKEFYYYSNSGSANNGASALVFKQGSLLGLSRVTRTLAIAAGYPEDEIIVGGDDSYFSFNLVKYDRRWFILDSVKETFNDRDMCSPSVFLTSSNYIRTILNPFYGKTVSSNDFIINHITYGYQDEYADPATENLKQWLNKNGKGILA